MNKTNSKSEQPRTQLGQRLRQARRYAGLTQLAAGEKIGVDPNTIARYEAGRITPSSPALFAMAQIYGRPVEWFYGEEGDDVRKEDAEDIDITDPELALFFRGEWDDLTDEEKEFIKGMIRESRELLRKRRESGA